MYRIYLLVALLCIAFPARANLLERKLANTPVTIDWASWGVSYNSASGSLYDDIGYAGPPTIDEVYGSGTDMVGMIRYRSGAEARYVSKFRRSGMSVSELGRLALSVGNEGIQSGITSLTSDLAVGFFMSTGVMNMFLIDTSSDTPTELAYDDFTAEMTDTSKLLNYASIVRRSDTEAILWYPEGAERNAIIVYTSGNTLSYSSKTAATRFAAEDASKVGDIHMIDEDHFMGFTVAGAYYFTIGANGAITLTDSQFLRGSTSAYTSTLGAIPFTTDKWVLISSIGTGATGDVWCDVITLSGSTLTRSSHVEVAPNTDLWPNGPEGKSTYLEDGVGFFTTINQTDDTDQVNLYKVSVDGSNVCTFNSAVASIPGDHSTVDRLSGSNGRYAVTFAQDQTSTPLADQITYKVLDGASP